MGLWIRAPRLADSETLLWKRLANRTQGGRAIGGALYLTEQRLLFQPHRIDALTGGKAWSAPLASILAAGTEARNGDPFSGGLRTRLRLDIAGSGPELFVVNKIDEVIEKITRAIS